MSIPITVVLSLPHPKNQAGADSPLAIDAALLDQIARRPVAEVLTIGSLHDLDPQGPTVKRLEKLDGSVALFSDLPPRAARWMACRLGLCPSWSCFEVADYEDHDSILAQLDPLLEKTSSPGEPVELERVDEEIAVRWHPIVDYEKCINCLECLNYCLFGVYNLDHDENILVENPAMCRPGCPACARVCPEGAIMFPYFNDPQISGRVAKLKKETPKTVENGLDKQDQKLDKLLDELDEF